MKDVKDPQAGFRTRAIRTGLEQRTEQQEHAEAIFATSSFVFASAAQAAARFAGDSPGNIYSRFTNPTVTMFQSRLAALEQGEACVATSSGMSAVLAVAMALLRAGDHVVAAKGMFGTTTSLFANYLTRFGIDVTFVRLSDHKAWDAAVRPNTRMLFVETPTNPVIEIGDISYLAGLAHANDSLLVVDNCFCTPALQRPLAMGADLVVHSATKYLDGQGRCVGGAVVGDQQRVAGDIFGFLRTAGPTMSPFNAWVFVKGLETLDLRMRAHCENAQRLAEWLAEQPAVERVHYPGLESHPQHELARRQQSGFGGIVSFELRGGRRSAWRVIDATRMISITANLGDVKTTITHPASTTHGRLEEADRQSAGITDGLLRLSVGLEDADDIIADLERGLSEC